MVDEADQRIEERLKCKLNLRSDFVVYERYRRDLSFGRYFISNPVLNTPFLYYTCPAPGRLPLPRDAGFQVLEGFCVVESVI